MCAEADHSTPIVLSRRQRWLVFLFPLLVALTFAAVTDHAWEDFWITYRPAKNLATGHGLVYQLGERVHTFTSPFSVLVPALLSAATGNSSDHLVLWLYRLIGGLCLGGAALLLLATVRHLGYRAVAVVPLLLLVATESKIVDFSINGQETAFLMLFMALTLAASALPWRRRALALGGGWAGLMWSRPDSFIYIGSLCLGLFLFQGRRWPGLRRAKLLRLFLVAGVIATLLYLPWFVGAWVYYGSPVPHPVIAKGLGRQLPGPLQLAADAVRFPWTILSHSTSVDDTFLPTYAVTFGGWPAGLILASRILGFLCAMLWLLPRARPLARAASLTFFAGHLYLTHVSPMIYPWYIPTTTLLAFLVLAEVFDLVAGAAAGRWRTRRGVTVAAAAVIVTVNLALTVCSAYQLRLQQRIIEDGQRKQIGLWLRRQARSPSETVFLEPLGYIGYFSQLRMYDYPGLCSPAVVAARARLGSNSWARLIRALEPDWLVLRPAEVEVVRREDPRLLRHDYAVARVFDVAAKIRAIRFLPGRGYLQRDQTFLVFRRQERHPAEPTGPAVS